ncbi:hypothetical protein GN956_G17097 [Arapaima gigas]
MLCHWVEGEHRCLLGNEGTTACARLQRKVEPQIRRSERRAEDSSLQVWDPLHTRGPTPVTEPECDPVCISKRH